MTTQETDLRSRPDAIHCHQVTKRFGGREAVSEVNLRIAAGSVHALVGENGAGKSTLMGVISGRHAPDEGTIEAFGRPLPSRDVHAIKAAGIAAIYQELTTFDALSATANVFVGQNVASRGLLRKNQMVERFRELCEAFGVRIDPHALAGELPLSQRQVLEILRGVQAQAKVMLFDEPTSALAEHEREALHNLIRRLVGDGRTVVLVSHNLDEVLDLSDRVSVMRDGVLVADAPRSEWKRSSLISAMVGPDTNVTLDRRPAARNARPVVLSIEGLSVPRRLENASLKVRAGEILGLWGLVGSGRTTLMRSIAGLEAAARGSMQFDGRSVPWPTGPRIAQAMGLALLPEDRRSALVAGLTGTENINLGRPDRGLLARRARERAVAAGADRFGFDRSRLSDHVGRLSGGNQQKILLAKWAARAPRVLLVDEPTRGIDIGAKAAVLSSLVDMAGQGLGIVATSSELDEVLSICDRLLVFERGRIVGEVASDSPSFNVNDIVRMGFGQ